MRRALVEGVVIVGSILLAFGVDAWWDGVQDRSEEALILRALETEFAENLDAFRAIHGVHLKSASELEYLIDLMSSKSDGEIIQVADTLLRPLISFRTADPATGTLNTLLASGRIDLIQNQALQQALAGWPAALEDTAEDERLVRDVVHGQLINGLMGDVELAGLLATWTSLTAAGQTQRDELRPSPASYPVTVTRSSRTLVGQRYHLGSLVVRASQDRIQAGERILEMIRREL